MGWGLVCAPLRVHNEHGAYTLVLAEDRATAPPHGGRPDLLLLAEQRLSIPFNAHVLQKIARLLLVAPELQFVAHEQTSAGGKFDIDCMHMVTSTCSNNRLAHPDKRGVLFHGDIDPHAGASAACARQQKCGRN